MAKPEFENINFDSDFICWGRGNYILKPNMIGRYKFRELTDEEKNAEQKKYDAAKEIYDTFINKGQKFKPAGTDANEKVEAVITFIHAEKQTITWKQINADPSFKAANGKWSINAMLSLVKQGKIIFI